MRSPTPTVEILTIGREILDGRVIDTNSTWLALRLQTIGLIPRYAQRVDDDLARVGEAFRVASARSDIVLVTGGLGPTADDLTAEAFAGFLGEPLELNEEALRRIKEIFLKLGRELTEAQRKQAYLPHSCGLLINTEGTAPGFMRVRARGGNSGSSAWYFMPGVPQEMKSMFDREVLPRLPHVEGYRSHFWVTQFISEGALQTLLAPVHAAAPPGFEITYRTRFPENHVGLHAVCRTEEDARAYESLVARITELLGDSAFVRGQEPKTLEEVVLDLLRGQGRMLATVESCTGGLVAHRITEIAGSSRAFWGGWVAYDNRAKEELGVDPALLRAHGAVSAEAARALAEAGLRKLRDRGVANPLCVATTGIAGPDGGSTEKPVGLCWIGLARAGQPVETHEVRGRIALRRQDYKQLFAQKALDFTRRALMRDG